MADEELNLEKLTKAELLELVEDLKAELLQISEATETAKDVEPEELYNADSD
ncbi:hypothetical protein LCGC14_2168020 [marine sediment metagenome]|uniref:Uncharacterized protein n=1 Tax=marine sediment metagenome TaxID=412755 RepID=A0A0F9ED23_9ZZZZ